jgi:hypothetical protein
MELRRRIMNRGPGSDRDRYGDRERWERQGNGGEQSESSWQERGEERGSRQHAGSQGGWSAERGRETRRELEQERRRYGSGHSSRGWEESGREAGRGSSWQEEYEGRGEWPGQWSEGGYGRESERGSYGREPERERFGGPSYGDWGGARGSYSDRNEPRRRGELYAQEWGGGSYRSEPRGQGSSGYAQSGYGFGGRAGSSGAFTEREQGSWGGDPWPGAPAGGAATRERGLHRGKGPKGYRRNDERIREDVCERLEDNPELDASDIEVTVSGGEVTLKGEVSDRRDKRIAEDCTEGISGVKDVTNQIRVRKGAQGQEQGGGERKSSAAASSSQRPRNQGSSTVSS